MAFISEKMHICILALLNVGIAFIPDGCISGLCPSYTMTTKNIVQITLEEDEKYINKFIAYIKYDTCKIPLYVTSQNIDTATEYVNSMYPIGSPQNMLINIGNEHECRDPNDGMLRFYAIIAIMSITIYIIYIIFGIIKCIYYIKNGRVNQTIGVEEIAIPPTSNTNAV